MNTQLYTYTGPLSSASLRVDGQEMDILLNPRIPVELPPEHPFTQTLLAQKRLMPVSAKPKAKAPGKGVTP